MLKSNKVRRGDKGYSLVIGWENPAGWCGWYSVLNGLDASDYNALTFWVKGSQTGERFDIGLKDSLMKEYELDAIYAGVVTSFLETGAVTKEWQKVKIPLSCFSIDINMSSLDSLVFWFRYENLRRSSCIMLEYDPEIERIEQYNAPRAEFNPRHPRTMWVWKIDPVLNLKARKNLFDLCFRAAIRTCYVYFGDFDEGDDPQYTKQLEEFLLEAHALGLRIEILTGNPAWALKRNHHFAYSWMKAFLDYNLTHPSELRVDGCSFDVEPYLSKEWEIRSGEVLLEYIDLLKGIRKLIDSYDDMNFEFGVPIPYFYAEKGDLEETIFKYIDYATLFSFYDKSYKIINFSRDHIELAARLGKKIYLSAETQDLLTMSSGRRSLTFYEEGWEAMEQVLTKVESEFDNEPGYAGIAIHCYYSYTSLQRRRNTPLKKRLRPEDLFNFRSLYQEGSVEIDGKLDDWILDNPIVLDHRVQVIYGRGSWNGEEDYSVKGYSMWDLYNLYFAFEVTDNTLVQDKTQADMWEGDHIEFWLDVDLLGDYNEAVNSKDDFQFGFSPGNFDDIEPEVYMYVPECDRADYLDKLDISAVKTENGYVIEVRIDASLFNGITVHTKPQLDYETQGLVSGNDMLTDSSSEYKSSQERFLFSENMMLGFSLESSDCDDPNAPQKLLMSTSSGRIWGDPTTFNVMKLIRENK